MMRAIPFTQFLRPDGTRKATSVNVPAAVWLTAQKLLEAGWRFEAEVLTTGHVSLECCRERPDKEFESLAHEIVRNGPDVLDAVHRLVEAAWKAHIGSGPQL